MPPEPTIESFGVAGVEYQARTWRLNPASFSPSGRAGLAAAAYSHSATVGNRLPFHCANALAANHEMCVTGTFAGVPPGGMPGSRSAAQSLRYASSAKILFTCERRQRGLARTNSKKSPFVTGKISSAKALTGTSLGSDSARNHGRYTPNLILRKFRSRLFRSIFCR